MHGLDHVIPYKFDLHQFEWLGFIRNMHVNL